jgi:transcriptional regulator
VAESVAGSRYSGMLVHRWDAPIDDDEWRSFLVTQGFGHLVAAGRDRPVPVVVPTQFVLDGPDVLLHLARPNPIWAAIDENPTVVLSVAGDWAFVPSSWKAIGGEDPRVGIPTTYYGAVQLTARAEVIDDPARVADVLRRQLQVLQPEIDSVDPGEHGSKLGQIRGLRLAVTDVKAKFKYGGNVDEAHQRAVADNLAERDGPGDAAARAHLLRRLAAGPT